MSKQPEQINSIYQQNSQLLKLAQHAKLIETLNHTLHQTLPLEFSAHCRIANINNKTLIIHTDNASFASLIRFQVPVLCNTFSTKLDIPLNHIEIKVRPNSTVPDLARTSEKVLPKTAALSLNQTAEVIDNKDLSLSLQKLAKRYKS